jgi:glycosyltransferase involved in cell wall biosynthesis
MTRLLLHLNEKINVVVLANHLSIGGIGRYCLNLVKELTHDSQLNVFLYALEDKSDRWLIRQANELGIEVGIIPMQYTYDIRAIFHLRQILKTKDVHVLHSQGYRSDIVSRLATKLFKPPIRLISTVHGVPQFESASLQVRLFLSLNYLSMSYVDHIISVSDITKEQLLEKGVKQHSIVIHNGTPIPPPSNASLRKNHARSSLKIPKDAKVVAFIGRLTYEKGIFSLISVIEQTIESDPDALFIIVGDGPLRELVEVCAQKYVGKVMMFGSQADVTTYYQSADVILIPSQIEGLPMVLLEAFAHGIPVIASKVGGIPEVIEHGFNGFMCEPEDCGCMSNYILSLLNKHETCARLGQNARYTAESRLSLAKMVEETRKLYLSTAVNG